MPLLDSFKVDHTIMPAPSIRLAKTMQTPKADIITVYDLRFCVPNKDILDEKGIHTLEHLFAGFMRKHLNSNNVEIIDISPMGCRTGFYMSLIGNPDEKEIKKAWISSMEDILKATQIPEANKFQCGSFAMHSLQEAKNIAKKILEKDISIINTKDLLLKDFE